MSVSRTVSEIFSFKECHDLETVDRRQNIAMTFSTEKLECCGYPTVKIF